MKSIGRIGQCRFCRHSTGDPYHQPKLAPSSGPRYRRKVIRNVQSSKSAKDVDPSSTVEDRSTAQSDPFRDLVSDSSFLNEFVKLENVDEALVLIEMKLKEKSEKAILETNQIEQLMMICLQRNAFDLCLKIYQRMISPRRLGSPEESLQWPEANFQIFSSLVLELTKCLRVKEALGILKSMKIGGVGESQEIVFGQVVSSPLPPYLPLTVVQPQEGIKTIPCASSRYLFEVFSGTVTSISSDSLERSQDLLLGIARFLKLWKKPPLAAIHQMIITTPSGIPRTFRFGTESAEVPAKLQDRVSILCAPEKMQEKRYGVLSPTAPGIRPGEAMTVVNHQTGITTPVLRAPRDLTVESIPSWIAPVSLVLIGSDLASSTVDSNLPAIGAAAIAFIGASTVIGNTAVLPRLKQLPENRLAGESLRQDLLRQHQLLVSRIDELYLQASMDVRTLAKLWQLESKMTSVDSSGKYNARIERIDQARQNLEDRLTGKMELMYGFRRVANMIEIEVEMDVDVPAAEVEGIEEQIIKLQELDNLQKEMEYQVEAQDEVERLLRSTTD